MSTILDQKQTFLTSQSRILSQPLTPSQTWHRRHNQPQPPPPQPPSPSSPSSQQQQQPPKKLGEIPLAEALTQSNALLSQHFHRLHAPQSTRHVAEQIDKLYYDAGETSVILEAPVLPPLVGQDDGTSSGVLGVGSGAGIGAAGGGGIGGGGGGPLSISQDFAEDTAISALPPEWEGKRESQRFPPEAARYGELVDTLSSLSEKRREVRERVERLRAMKEVLEPFGDGTGEEDGEGGRAQTPSHVQENLVVRNGDIEKELEKMRMLLARVGGRVAQLPQKKGKRRRGDDEMEDVESREAKKVLDLLERM